MKLELKSADAHHLSFPETKKGCIFKSKGHPLMILFKAVKWDEITYRINVKLI